VKRFALLYFVAAVCACALIATPAAWGQAATSLRGTITDPSGGAIPNARVHLRWPRCRGKTVAGCRDGKLLELQLAHRIPFAGVSRVDDGRFLGDGDRFLCLSDLHFYVHGGRQITRSWIPVCWYRANPGTSTARL
jgi:hypothetical protein